MKLFIPTKWIVALPQSNKLQLQSIARLCSPEANWGKLRSAAEILMPLYSLDPATLQNELPLKTFGKTARKSTKLLKIQKKVAHQHRQLQLPRPQDPLGPHVWCQSGCRWGYPQAVHLRLLEAASIQFQVSRARQAEVDLISPWDPCSAAGSKIFSHWHSW